MNFVYCCIISKKLSKKKQKTKVNIDIYIFSQFKTYQELRQATDLLLKIKRKYKSKILKNEVENFVKDNFENEGFGGKKWTTRKTQDRSDRNNPDKARQLLTKIGRLTRSIKVSVTVTTKLQ